MFDGLSLLQKTVIRNKDFGKPSIIIGEEHRFFVAEQMKEIQIEADLIIEPFQKNTAPCSIIGALLALEDNKSTVLLIPSDHYIDDNFLYISAIKQACNYVEKYGVATLGITPSFPHTGYGYIKCGRLFEKNVYEAIKFIEKPDLKNAQDYVEEGNYFWNSGIFIFQPRFMIDQTKLHQSALFEQVCQSFCSSSVDLDFIRLAVEPYLSMESISIDHAIMEHLSSMVLIKSDFIWNDLGSWDSVWNISKKDVDFNYLEGDIIASSVSNAYVHSPNKMTALIGLDNIIVINTEDALLVADKSRSEEVKHIVNQLISSQKKEAIEHATTFRPWGHYHTIDRGDLYKVKRITVNPGQKLSLQYHRHRAEHWVIISGIAKVFIGGKITILYENDSIYIPKSMRHRLTNIGEIPLRLIEVQTGPCLDEDDIVRLNDAYGRG